MFKSLGNKLQDAFQKLRGEKYIKEEHIADAIQEVRRAMLESDVSLDAVKRFTTLIKERAVGLEVTRGIKPSEQFIKMTQGALEEILEIASATPRNDVIASKAKQSILLLGLQGAGKTTAAAKLALKLKTEDKKALLVACDLQRPAAIKQLEILAEQAGVDFLKAPDSDLEELQKLYADTTKDNEREQAQALQSKILKQLIKESKSKNYDSVIFDTAGRLQIDSNLMSELKMLETQIGATEKLLVLDSLTGQEAANVAKTFDAEIGITGSILTKLDSDTKGGAALSLVDATQKPIKFASVGEKLEDLEEFHSDRIASRILGMGDVVSLVEKAELEIEEEEAKRLEAELMSGNFNYETFVTAQNMISKLGNFGSLFNMMGMGNMLNQMGLGGVNQDEMLEQGEAKIKKYKIAISSMTKTEKKKPDLISKDSSARSRRKRIAQGAGLQDKDLDQMVSEFTKISSTFKQLGPMLNMMKGAEGSEAGGEGAMPANVNPMDMMSQMMQGGMSQSLSKKQQKAMKKMGGMGAANPPKKKQKKGSKPQIKGFGF